MTTTNDLELLATLKSMLPFEGTEERTLFDKALVIVDEKLSNCLDNEQDEELDPAGVIYDIIFDEVRGNANAVTILNQWYESYE